MLAHVRTCKSQILPASMHRTVVSAFKGPTHLNPLPPKQQLELKTPASLKGYECSLLANIPTSK